MADKANDRSSSSSFCCCGGGGGGGHCRHSSSLAVKWQSELSYVYF